MLAKKYRDRAVKRNNKRKLASQVLPVIPDKRYFTISEVSDLCGIKAYVLRYWEQEFPHLRPVKRRGNRRYYQQHDIILIRQIKKLLYEEGFTIEGARQRLANTPDTVNQPIKMNAVVKKVISELEIVLRHLQPEVKATTTH